MVTCPGCNSKIKVDRHLSPPKEAVSSAPKSAAAASESSLPYTGIDDSDMDDSGMDYEADDDEALRVYEEHDQIALILDDSNKEVWSKTLSEFHPSWGSLNLNLAQEEGYKLEFAKSPGHAVHKLKFIQYNMVALAENYGDVPLAKNRVFRYLLGVPMEQRRKMFVALTGDHFKTLNDMQAFAYSVNVVINNKDTNILPQIIKKSIREHEIFYKVFREIMSAHGKA